MSLQYFIIQTTLFVCVSAAWRPWSSWSECSQGCGIGMKERRRMCNVSPCYGRNRQERICIFHRDCPGHWLNWGEWSMTCDQGCGKGFKKRTRLCRRQSSSARCSGSRFQRAPCTFDGDCKTMWLWWNPWSACSITCGRGTKTRTRACQRRYKISTCSGESNQTLTCTRFRDCQSEWLQWGPWNQCHVRCGEGIKSRHRTCDNVRGTSATSCRGEASEHRPCRGEIDCEAHWQPWLPWGACGLGCLNKRRTRRRYCFKPYRYSQCNGPRQQMMRCAAEECKSEWTTWSVWTDCHLGCGIGQRRRQRRCISFYSGAPRCQPARANNEIKPCTVEIDCPAKWTSWSSWGNCSANCGPRSRNRTCVNPSNARPCVGDEVDDEPCPITIGCVGTWTEWGAYGRCDGGCGAGYKHRRRRCIKPFPDVNCTGSAIGKRKCSYRVDCKTEWATWKAWNECNQGCGKGTKQRIRNCQKIRPLDQCVGENEQTANCTKRQDCPAHWNEWSPWSNCHGSCSNYTKDRLRFCIRETDDDKCQGNKRQVQICPQPLKCIAQWKSWGHWSDCDVGCGIGTKSRQRICNRKQIHCNGTNYEAKQCVPQEDCSGDWETWEDWGDCSEGCGLGVKSRQRGCSSNEENLPCVGNSNDSRICTVISDCVAKWSTWDDWSECSDGCGIGFKHRQRRCIHPVEHTSCVGEYRQPMLCSVQVDCPTCPENCKRCKDDINRCDPGHCKPGYTHQLVTGTCKAESISDEGMGRLLQYLLAFVIVSIGSILIATICYRAARRTNDQPETFSRSRKGRRFSSLKSTSAYAVLSQPVEKLSVLEAKTKHISNKGSKSTTCHSFTGTEEVLSVVNRNVDLRSDSNLTARGEKLLDRLDGSKKK